MKIRKVDDKPMVIHTKEKAKIHAHEPKGAKIKGSNIYTVERGPKTAGAKVTDTDRKKSYRKSTIHQSEPKNKGLSRFKQNLKESNTSIKTKNTNLHIAGRTGALAAGAVTEQVEGGQEVSQAAYLAYEASRPVTGTASKGAALFRKKAAAEAKKRIKKVEAGKKLAKKTAKKAAKDTAKAVAKETAKETAKTTAKVATKTATKAAATAAGTAVAPGVGTAIGMAAGYAAGVSIEVKDEKMTNRSRKIKFFLDKMKAQENQTDSVAKLVKDLIVRKAITWVKAAAPIIGLVLLLLVLVVAMIAVPVIAVIAILYNSPFALFLPPLESGDTVQTVTSAYVQEFNRDVNTKVNEHTGYDLGELVYVDYEGMEEKPSNYYDIMAVYMVKHGVGDKIIVDPEAAEVVKLIFELTAQGKSKTEVANYLNANGIDTPSAYKKRKGIKKAGKSKEVSPEEKLAALEKKVKSLSSKKMMLYSDYKDDKLTREEYVKRSKAMVEQIDELHQKIEQLKSELPTEDNSAGKFETQLENIINMESFDREKIQKVIKKVIINGEDNIEIVWNTDDLFFK